MLEYELLFIEDGIYYLKYYPFEGCKGINLKMNREEYLDWIDNDDKVEV